MNIREVLPVTDCTQESFEFPAVKRRKVEATFSGGEISSDGGVVLLREADRHLGLLEAASRVLHDPRDSGKVVHSQLSLLRQRVYGLCLGYEDLNDHQELRRDPAIQTAVERSEVLASQATLCRLEHRMDRQAAVALHPAPGAGRTVHRFSQETTPQVDSRLRCHR